MAEIIIFLTCIIILTINMIACCLDAQRIDKLAKRIDALEGKQK